jgi:hypothetical protein
MLFNALVNVQGQFFSFAVLQIWIIRDLVLLCQLIWSDISTIKDIETLVHDGKDGSLEVTQHQNRGKSNVNS